MTLFVAGGNGFLGKRVCHLLNEKDIKFVSNSLRDGIDYRNLDHLKKFIEENKVDTIINCAAYVGGIQFGLKHQGEMFYNNMLMTLNFLECSRIYKLKRVVNPISNCAYPGKASLFKEEEFWDGPIHDSVLAYGFARKASWVGAFSYNHQYGADWVNLILSNMYGPQDHFEPERSHALGALIMRIVEAKEKELPEVVLWGTGKPVREWLYVDDGAEALIRALNIAPVTGPVNIGVAQGLSIFELAQMIAKHVNYTGKLGTDPSKPDGAPYKTVDGTLGEKLLNWKPQTNLEEGLSKTIDWYMKHKQVLHG